MTTTHYLVRRGPVCPPLNGRWNRAPWSDADTLEVGLFHRRSTNHHPRTSARLLYDDRHLHVFFHVRDQFVRSVHTQYQDPVCRDSCVEFFVQPTPLHRPCKGYFNFEINCGGTMLLYLIEDSRPGGSSSGFTRGERVAAHLAADVRILHSMPPVVEPEITAPVDWIIAYSVPYKLFEYYLGPVRTQPGATWRANFYKCADRCTRPHWASWAPIGSACNFHQPDRFGVIEFA